MNVSQASTGQVERMREVTRDQGLKAIAKTAKKLRGK
jgi:hypothetical protein